MIHSQTPEWAEPYVIRTDHLIFDGDEYEYLIISSGSQEKGAPKVFVIGNNGVLAASETYPDKYRELGLIHEIIEFRNKPPLPENACVESLKQELTIAQARATDMEQYGTFRITFFSDLIKYYKEKPSNPVNDALILRMRRSLEHLHHFSP